ENDGFPFAATEEEIRQFDKAFFHGKQSKPKKSWAKSFSEGTPLASLRRLQALLTSRMFLKLSLGLHRLALMTDVEL
ncbi:FYVE RhoGEF and PH domain-containing protein 5-like isoform X1, partial [Biomphalaria pfeifferi]